MINAENFISHCLKFGFNTFTGTPCSFLKPLINRVIEDERVQFVGSVNEGDAVALASGLWLGGKNSVVMFQNSGLGNAVNPLTSLASTFRIPFLGVVTLRGNHNGKKDEPQHELMGAITPKMLDLMEIPWSYLTSDETQLAAQFETAMAHIKEKQTPYFFIMAKDTVAPYELQKDKTNNARGINHPLMTRTEALKVVVDLLPKETGIVATTGKTGRELFEVADRDKNFYMVGSMGCALSIGLGMSLANTKNPVCVIDGDGALLMRTGPMATAAKSNPKGLVHLLLDNGVHDSTGGQPSGSEQVDFCLLAKAMGYPMASRVTQKEELAKAITDALAGGKLTFIHCLIKIGSPAELGRPTVKPYDVARRVRGNC